MVSFHHFLIAALAVTSVGSLIVPDEITSLLSLIYSNIPPIKKGTDSRVGVGFRLGPHADFQVVLELGPQTNTQPIGNTADSKRRRNSDDQTVARPLANTLDSKRRNGGGGSVDKMSNSWLSNWRSSLAGGGDIQKLSYPGAVVSQRRTTELKRTTLRKDNDDVMTHLHQLYKNKESLSSDTNTTETS